MLVVKLAPRRAQFYAAGYFQYGCQDELKTMETKEAPILEC